MDFRFLTSNIPWFKAQSNNDSEQILVKRTTTTATATATTLSEQPKSNGFDFKLLGLSLLSFVPWVAVNSRDNRVRAPSTINRGLRRRAQPRGVFENGERSNSLRFRPYVSRVPWHTGVRGFLSQLFPRYGHYCGPNWSSGKDGGSPLWDKRPIDWLDFCCYCHDIGYDSHNQGDLLKADLAFLECLERPNMSTKGDVHTARLYKTMCITGLRNFLIPYRTHLLKLHAGQPLIQFGWLSNARWKVWNFQKT